MDFSQRSLRYRMMDAFIKRVYDSPEVGHWRSKRGTCEKNGMATVTVLKFPTVEGAEETLKQIWDLKRQHLIKLQDAAIVSWPSGKKSPQTRQLLDLAGVSVLSGMFWGTLFGMIFVTPVLGAAIGAAYGALRAPFLDFGIDDDFIKQIQSQVTEGTSALFLMTSDAVIDRVVDALKDVKFEIIATNLSEEQEQKLREAFGHE
jgi:uncharacterized membrane protein